EKFVSKTMSNYTNLFKMRKIHQKYPTTGRLLYPIAQVLPHDISRSNPQEIDPWVYPFVKEFITDAEITDFMQYTRSLYTEEGHYKNLLKYDKSYLPRPKTAAYLAALQHTSDCFRLPEPVRDISFDNLADVPFIASSSAGYSYHGSKGDNDNHTRAIKRVVATIRGLQDYYPSWKQSYRYTPDIAYARTQLSLLNTPKVRHVWGKAFHNIIIEGKSAYPLIHAYSSGEYPISTGIHIYHKIPAIIAEMFSEPEPHHVYLTDFSGFDSSPMDWLIYDAFDILEQNLIFNEDIDKLCFEYSKFYFVNTPVKMPDGYIWVKHIGVPSGSYFTQLIDSVIDHIVLSYCQFSIWNRFFDTKVLGDDSIFKCPTSLIVPISTLARTALQLGFTIHPDKSKLTDDQRNVDYLGHLERAGRIWRPHTKSLQLALFPEYPVHSAAESVTRVKGICLDTGLNSWNLLRLLQTMTSYYGQGTTAWSHEDANFINSVVMLQKPPSHTDFLAMWTIT
ncbi:RNA-dependent RNA polymerase, partial [viral metagenome]